MRGQSAQVFGRRDRKLQEEEAAKEAERRALFAELAQRPDTVCPFLGMVDARTSYENGVSDGHRCYAFGDPAELSSEQQTKVCLQRGYGNCPRYLRGVLVIPTEELEALRRPLPPSAKPPAPKPVVVAKKRRSYRGLLAAVVVILLLGAAGGGGYWYLRSQVASSAVADTLPAGTGIGAELISLSAPDGNAQDLHATAFIGETDAAASTALVYVLDLSGSNLRGEGCGGDRNEDGLADTPLDCQVAAAAELNAQAVASGAVGEVGLVGFASGAVTADVSAEDGAQGLAEPDLDQDGNGAVDAVESIESAFSAREGRPVGFGRFSAVDTPSTSTEYSAGIGAACDVLADTANPNRLVVFLSDGQNSETDDVASVLPCANATVFQSFAVGPNARCVNELLLGSLQDIADLTGGTCTEVPDLSQLPEILEAVVVPQILRIQLTIDDGEPIDISQAATPSLPEPGPTNIEIDYPIPALSEGDHRLCMTVFATDAGGPGSITSCSPVSSSGGRLTSTD